MSYCSRSGWCSSAVYIVGTPAKEVTLSRSISSSALPGSKRGSSVSSPRARIAMFITEFMPNTWNSGSVASPTVSGPASTRSRAVSAPVARFACVSVAPFGVPVVPDV